MPGRPLDGRCFLQRQMPKRGPGSSTNSGAGSVSVRNESDATFEIEIKKVDDPAAAERWDKLITYLLEVESKK